MADYYQSAANVGPRGSATMTAAVVARVDAVPSSNQLLLNVSDGQNGYRIDTTASGAVRARVRTSGGWQDVETAALDSGDVGKMHTFCFAFGDDTDDDGGTLILYWNGLTTADVKVTGTVVEASATASTTLGAYDNGTLEATDLTIMGAAIANSTKLEPADVQSWHQSCVGRRGVADFPSGTTVRWDFKSKAKKSPSTWGASTGSAALSKTGSPTVQYGSGDPEEFGRTGTDADELSESASFTAPAGSTAIMPTGDSLTVSGGSVSGAYRTQLETELENAGITFDFVGAYSEGPAGLSDKDHGGVAGEEIADVDARIATEITNNSPDLILLMIGTNDAHNASDTNKPTMHERLDTLLDTIFATDSGVTVIVGKIPPQPNDHNNAWVYRYNRDIPKAVKTQQNAGFDCQWYDVGGVVTVDQITDYVHPDQAGYDAMAGEWIKAIKAVLDAS